jgi:hypothetical protein
MLEIRLLDKLLEIRPLNSPAEHCGAIKRTLRR